MNYSMLIGNCSYMCVMHVPKVL